MSFEGYFQVICKNRHYHEVDYIYDRPCNPKTDEEFKCPMCGAAPLWENLVDDTNCDERGKVEMEIDQPEHLENGKLQPETVRLPLRDNGTWYD